MSAAGSNPAPSAADPDQASSRTDFHLTRGLAVAALGRVAPLAGVGVLAVMVVSALVGDASGTGAAVALVLAWSVAVLGGVLTLVAAVRTIRPPVLARLDVDGVRVRVLRGGGPRTVSWADVRTVRRESLRAGPCVVIELTDGRRSVLPERLVDEGGAALDAALRARLDTAHGQRRLAPGDVSGGGGI